MKICQKCFQPFDETLSPSDSPAEVLGDIFIDSAGNETDNRQEGRDLCPTCREALGVVNILGFSL